MPVLKKTGCDTVCGFFLPESGNIPGRLRPSSEEVESVPSFKYSRPCFSPMGERVYELMLSLVAIPSVTGSEDGGENRCARFIHDWLARIPYFRDRPSDLRLVRLEGDPLERMAVCALLRASRETRRTVILTGHFDVVDTDVCGPLRPWAFDPETYTDRIAGLRLADDARRDLESGNYLFGRGVSDMKTGIALNLCLIEDYASERDILDFNVLLLLVPDEEGDSAGMRLSIPTLLELQEEEGLDFVVCVNTEPVLERGGPGIYYGTIGKIMPLFLCVGRETHVADYTEGLNSTLIASYLNLAVEGHGGRAERFGGQKFPPDCCLRMRDLRERYAVTLPERTVVYYNCLTVSRTPASILESMRGDAERALRSAFEHVGNRDWPVRVLDVEELVRRAAVAAGTSRDRLTDELLSGLSASDERDRNVEFLSRLLDRTGEKGPLVVVGFLPPYYPSRLNEGRTVCERAVRRAAEAVRLSLGKRGWSFSETEIFQGISDLSYMGFRGRAEDIAPVAANMPLWGRGYDISLEDLRRLDIPSVLLGPMGADDHKITERVELDYSMNVLPEVVKEFLSVAVRESFTEDGEGLKRP